MAVMASPSPRCRFQFSLRTLMIGVTLVAVACGYVGRQVKIVRERYSMLAQITDQKNTERGNYGLAPSEDSQLQVPWIRRLLGDQAIYAIGLPITASKDYRRKVRELFPEAIVASFVMRGPRSIKLTDFPDEQPKHD
jgi:hypothetical protein